MIGTRSLNCKADRGAVVTYAKHVIPMPFLTPRAEVGTPLEMRTSRFLMPVSVVVACHLARMKINAKVTKMIEFVTRVSLLPVLQCLVQLHVGALLKA